MMTVWGISTEGPAYLPFGPFPRGSILRGVRLHIGTAETLGVWCAVALADVRGEVTEDQFAAGQSLFEGMQRILLGSRTVPLLVTGSGAVIDIPLDFDLGSFQWAAIRFSTSGGLGQGFCAFDVELPPRGKPDVARGVLPGEAKKGSSPGPPTIRRR